MSADTPDAYPSRTYKMSLTVAGLLFLGTLTLAAIVILIANARNQSREEEHESTLTAVWSEVVATQTAIAVTPPPGPTVIAGQYAFAPVPDSPVYLGDSTCEEQILTGEVLDRDGVPSDAYRLLVWGDYLAPQTIPTGELAGQRRGRWRLEFPLGVNRRVWVQVIGGDRFLSAPVEVIFDADACAQSAIEVTFQQIAPVN